MSKEPAVVASVTRRTYIVAKADPITVADVLAFADKLRAHGAPPATQVWIHPGYHGLVKAEISVCIEKEA